MTKRRNILWLMLLTVVMALPITASAQIVGACLGDDGTLVPGACCVPVVPVLPPFPGAQIPSRGACLLNCALEQSWGGTVLLGQPMPIFCDLYVTQFTVVGGPTPINTSLVVMKYARTWTEFTPIAARQVWRFLVNTDVTYVPTAVSVSPCPIPPCSGITIGLNLPVHFTGSIEYALDCFTGQWSTAFNLTHLCGTFNHSPGSTRPLPPPFDHAERTYCFAGPAPFVFAPNAPMAGPFIGDQTRSTQMDLTVFPPLWNCMSENMVFGGGLNPVFQGCPCSNPAAPSVPSWTNYNAVFDYGCAPGTPVGIFNSVPIGGALPTGLASMSIGRYAGPAGSFPGTRSIDLWIGVASAPDLCPLPGLSLPFHIVHGVSHQQGDFGTTFPNVTGASVTTDKFLDFENMLIPNGGVPTGAFMGIGSLFVSTQVWSLNLP